MRYEFVAAMLVCLAFAALYGAAEIKRLSGYEGYAGGMYQATKYAHQMRSDDDRSEDAQEAAKHHTEGSSRWSAGRGSKAADEAARA